MNYWVCLTMDVDTGGPEPYQAELYRDHPVDKAATLWRHAGCDLEAYDGRTAVELLETLCPAVVKMEAAPLEYVGLVMRYAWATYESCLEFLQQLQGACESHPKATVNLVYP